MVSPKIYPRRQFPLPVDHFSYLIGHINLHPLPISIWANDINHFVKHSGHWHVMKIHRLMPITAYRTVKSEDLVPVLLVDRHSLKVLNVRVVVVVPVSGLLGLSGRLLSPTTYISRYRDNPSADLLSRPQSFQKNHDHYLKPRILKHT